MASFYETRFPTDISSGSRGGPGYRTGVTPLFSGHEKRSARWPYPRSRYDVRYGVKKASQLEALARFFHAMQGRAYGFRYKDPIDYNSAGYGQTVSADDLTLLNSAVGGETTLQLFKTYTQGSKTTTRLIRKPVAGTVVLKKNGAALTEGVDFTVDTTTGIVTFTVALSASDTITGGFEFDVPVRFDIDVLDIQLEGGLLGNTSVPIVELRV
jgi:uncharacterized protein (TIGR02217 family)